MRVFGFALGLLLILSACTEESELHIKISTGEFAYLDCPVEINLDSIKNHLADTDIENIKLLELTEGRETEIPYQLHAERLAFIMNGVSSAGTSRHFVLKKGKTSEAVSEIQFIDSEDKLNFSTGENGKVVYHKKENYPPEGIDTIFKRSAFLHPVTTPAGEVLTRINPPGHYHHYGLWNPWTKTHIGEREIDYWNLGKGQGTVRYHSTEDAGSGPLFGYFEVNHQVIDKGHFAGERVSMNESWNVKIWNTDVTGKRYLLDLYTDFTNVLEDTILFDAYRYGGGLGYRSPEKWKANNCTVLTSEGLSRDEADGTKARWIIIEGEAATEVERAGILFLSHPDNREHPEPVRVWPTSSSGGELMFDYCPIRHKEWIIEPGKTYTLKYRMIVFDGRISTEEAELYWNGFAHPPVVRIK